MSANFVSLHNHTEYSFLDGAIRIKDLAKAAKDFGMPAVAITDHGGLFGAVEFYEACKEAKIKPIIGFEAYVAPKSRLDKTASDGERDYCHLILLAENNAGWKNLMKLSTIGYLEGFYRKPRVDMEVLRKHSEGIIATSACVAGAIPRAIIDGDMKKARALTEEYISIFGKNNFFFELQDHGMDEEKIAMKGLIELGREMDVPFIVANDAHYLRREDAKSHEILLCIGTQDTMDNPKRFQFSSDEIYFKSPEEMAELFPDIPEAMTNTVKIAERCDVNIKVNATLPSIEVPEEFGSPENYLTRLAKDGLTKKYEEITPELEKKLDYELGVINSMGFASYFLIVRDFVFAAQNMGVMVGCRGSAAGSLTAYAVGITNVDPLKYDLIFERFLNPERISMPDADIDFADKDRYRVIDYVVDKYGRDAVCQIINFGTMMAKGAVKDVARTLGISVSERERLSKMIAKKTIKDSIAANSELAEMINGNEQYQSVFKHAEMLEGLTRQPGMHAGGVIIAPSAASDWAPLFKQSNSDIIMTQFDMNYVEKVGLVKMDFLGLITLTVLQETLRLIKKYHGKEFDLWKLPENDEKTFALFCAGETTGIFQFESGGMKEHLRKLKPSRMEDLIAMAALYRPGPMENIGMFIDRKHGKIKIEYPHPMLENILDVTYGVIVYQEQVMRIAQVMGGFTLGMADVLRKAMSKKQVDTMEEMGKKFIDGAHAQGIDKKVAKEVFDLMAKFAGYGFNKAHAAVYAHLSYHTAYLKAHYPLEYMTGYLAAYLGDLKEFTRVRSEVERLGIRVLPPDINKSDFDFSIENGTIRIGLGAVKNVGKAAEVILGAREKNNAPFTSIFDLCKSTDNRIVNKKALESLIAAGAFDCFGGTRSQHFEAVAKALEYGANCHEEQASGQVNLFDSLLGSGDTSVSAPEPALPQAAPWTISEQLKREKEILGFYASGHPLEQFKDEINGFSNVNTSPEALNGIKNGTDATIGGMITSIKKITTKNGKEMAFLNLETFDSSVELVAFADVYEKFKELLTAEAMILAHGKLNKDDRGVKINLDNCMALSDARDKLCRFVHLRLSTTQLDKNLIDDIYGSVSVNQGKCGLIIHLTTENQNNYRIKAGNVNLTPAAQTLTKLREFVGEENVWITRTA